MTIPAPSEVMEATGTDEAAARRICTMLAKGPNWTGCHWTHDVAEFLGHIDKLSPATHGVEFIPAASPGDDGIIAYLNTGDTYSACLLMDEAGRSWVGTWGGEYEAAEAEHTEETGEVRCGYCGEWIAPQSDDPMTWREWVCENCGRSGN